MVNTLRVWAAILLLFGAWIAWAGIHPGNAAALAIDTCNTALRDFQDEHPRLVRDALAVTKCVAKNPGWDPATRTLRFQIDPAAPFGWPGTFARGYVHAWGDQLAHLKGSETTWAEGRGIPVEKAWDDWMEIALSSVNVSWSGAHPPPGIDGRFLREGRHERWFPPRH